MISSKLYALYYVNHDQSLQKQRKYVAFGGFENFLKKIEKSTCISISFVYNRTSAVRNRTSTKRVREQKAGRGHFNLRKKTFKKNKKSC